MKDHEGDHKGFIHLSRSWYGEGVLKNSDEIDSVLFGFFSPDGGTSGEMEMSWENIGRGVAIKLKAWNDSWHALGEFKDVIDEMAKIDGEDITPDEFCKILMKCGFKDDTKTLKPESSNFVLVK
jgi:hypothetical protein